MSKRFRSWDVDQQWLLPPSVQDFVPEGHPAHFVRELVRGELDLGAILSEYEEERGQPPYDPRMMTALLLYAYTQGVYSSRRIARGCEERVDFMAVTALQRPDFRTVNDFRKRHLRALGGMFVQVLRLCGEAGLVKLGHVALDGSKIRANASKHKGMSYRRMKKEEERLRAQVRRWFELAEAADAEEDEEYGADRRGDELPDSATDRRQLVPLIDGVREGTGRDPREVSADCDYCSEANLEQLEARGIRGYVATGKQQHGQPDPVEDRKTTPGTHTHAMKIRIRRGGYRSRYRLRKQTVEPVFGQIKAARGFRQFLLRGIDKVSQEWALICTAHNLSKLMAVARA